MTNFDIKNFVKQPSTETLKDLRKSDWLKIASTYNIQVKSNWKKSEVKRLVVHKLMAEEVLPEDTGKLCEDDGDSILCGVKVERA